MDSSEVHEVFDFENAQENSIRFAPSFEAPSWEDLRSLKVDQIVKVCHNDERFWVVLVKILGNDEVIGRIDNDLVRPHPFQCGDLIKFRLEHVYSIF